MNDFIIITVLLLFLVYRMPAYTMNEDYQTEQMMALLMCSM